MIISSQGFSKPALGLFFLTLSLSLPSTIIAICLFSSPSPFLSPCLPLSCQGVYMCSADGRVPNKVERIRGEKTVLLPAMFSLFSSISLSHSLALTVDIFQLMYSWPLLPRWSINKIFICILNNSVKEVLRFPNLVEYCHEFQVSFSRFSSCQVYCLFALNKTFILFNMIQWPKRFLFS